MTIAQVEDMDGVESEEWKHHIARRPFLIDFLDMCQAHICQAVVQSMGGKAVKLEKFLLVERKASRRQKPEGKTYMVEPD